MIISVASGKGGTGKTTVATNLAFALGEQVALLDCDVEEPNAHLFLKPVVDRTETTTVPVPVVDPNKCTLCGKCVDICRFRAIIRLADKMLTFPNMCHSCGGCLAVCPDEAITEQAREYGNLEFGHRDAIGFVSGRINVGEPKAPPLIRQVRAEQPGAGTVIVDAPPGTTCPVVTAVKGADFVVLVTEPTPFGLHDLKLAHEVMQLLAIPSGLVINRSDLGDGAVADYAQEVGLPVLMEIPFDRGIAEAYSEGRLLCEADPAWKQRFLDLHARIAAIVASGRSGS